MSSINALSADLAGMGGDAGKTTSACGPAERAQNEGQDGRRSLFKPANHDGSKKLKCRPFQALSKGSEATRVAKRRELAPGVTRVRATGCTGLLLGG